MSSMISLIVIFLVASAYAAPLVPDIQNVTAFMEAENATINLEVEKLVVLARRDTSDVSHEKRGNDTVGLSSSSSEDEADTVAPRDYEDSSVPSSSETNVKRDVDTEVNQSSDDTDKKRDVTEDPLSTEINSKRDTETDTNDERSAADEQDTKRDIEVESSESSTVVDDTSVPPSSQMNIAKRGSWLSADPDDQVKTVKRSSDGSWLSDGSDDQVQKRSFDIDETSTPEETSVPSTSEVINAKRDKDQSSALSAKASEEFNKRAIGSPRPTDEVPDVKRSTKQSSSSIAESSDEFNKRAVPLDEVNTRSVPTVESIQADESSTVIVVKIEPESTTEEQISSSTVEDIVGEVSSTIEYETTVVPVEDLTTVSVVPSESTAKILAIIPGIISKTQMVVQPVVEQVQLTQGQNQTIVENNKPNY